MAGSVAKDIVVYLCHNCLPAGVALPRQWRVNGAHVHTQLMPCSGKLDAQYLFRAFEAGARGVCVATCPTGECQLAQGNYRAEVRVRTVRRLLDEIGLGPERIELLQVSPEDEAERLKDAVAGTVERFCALGASPLAGEVQSTKS
jgi:F420-non-reducing hydrogenase iron-sulfur subunit